MADEPRKETKAELRDHVFALEQQKAIWEAKAKDWEKAAGGVITAFSDAIRSVNENCPSSYSTLASVVILFCIGLSEHADMSFDPEPDSSEALEEICEAMGFDQVTSMIISQKHRLMRRGIEMMKQGKSMDEVLREIGRLVSNGDSEQDNEHP